MFSMRKLKKYCSFQCNILITEEVDLGHLIKGVLLCKVNFVNDTYLGEDTLR